MTGSFYGVLGVGPDADDEEIRRAYREQVKEHHPDVSSRPGARERFKRLTTAKETLTDEHERARYDRLGHASYVREHVDSSAWSAEGSTSPFSESRRPGEVARTGTAAQTRSETTRNGNERARTRTGTSYSRSGAASRETGGTARESDPASESGVDDESGSTDRTDAGAGRTDTGADDPGSNGSSAAANGHSEATAGEAASSRDGGNATGASARDGSSGTTESGATGTASGRATGTSGRARAADVGGDAGGRNSRADSRASGSYAHSSFWDATDPRPGRAYDPARYEDPLWERVISGLRTLGPWVLVHAVFLSLAAGSSWFVYTRILSDPAASPALLLVLVGEVCLAVVLSTLHVLSQLYR